MPLKDIFDLSISACKCICMNTQISANLQARHLKFGMGYLVKQLPQLIKLQLIENKFSLSLQLVID